MHRAPQTAPLFAVALFACALAAPEARAEVQLLPAGQFAARDGRPGPGKRWQLSDADGRRLAAALNERKTPLVIDYEHQTLAAEHNGQPAPAAGWASAFEWRDGKGLFATDVKWTERAQAYIKAGEYRFISPVFASRKADGVVIELLHAALVNNPALDGMADVADRIAARYAASSETSTMNPLLQKLVAALGLAADATEETALTALSSIKANADEAEALRQKLTTAEGEVSALKAKGNTPDAETLSAMNKLQAEVSALRTAAATRELDEVVGAALKAGKLLPAQEKWARDLGSKDLAALKSYLDTAPAVPALAGTQSSGRPAAGASADAVAIAAKAQAYVDEQAKHGRIVSAAEAVKHVQTTA